MHPLLLFSLMIGIFLASPLAVAQEAFPKPFDTETSTTKPLAAEEAVKHMELPPGFQMTVFATEPDVCQPISMTTDTRGRLWVAENYSYSERPVVFNEELRDRILIFEDTDNDGKFDQRTVFWEGAQRLMSIEVGSGGVWALCLPELLFIPDSNGDDVPDDKPTVALDGFVHKQGSHTVANGLRWGPDGWLYGRQGILANSLVGRPGADEGQRTKVNVGIWRYHPLRKVFENVAVGTTNPWGMDWDARGEMFFINTVIGHLWHVIPGAHYRRMSGGDLDPRIYDIIEQHADHVHWATTEVWTDVRKGVTDATMAAGGGHAHTGLLIYQGGQWPESWNGKLLTVNYHGKRLNVERLERQGSGFVGRREPDAFLSSDPWFRGLDLIAAPDGGVYLSDWSDTGECHDNDGVHRSSGRIYKITFGESKRQEPGAFDLNRLPNVELAKRQLSSNDWEARASRRVLADRRAKGVTLVDASGELARIVANEMDPVRRLRALWALHVSIGSEFPQVQPLLADPNENLRAWAIRLLEEQSHESHQEQAAFYKLASEELPKLARNEPSGLVRLTLASLLQKLPHERRAPIASALLARSEDADDHNQPLMLWYGILPLAESMPEEFTQLIAQAQMPIIQRYGARRLAEDLESAPARLDALLQKIADKPHLNLSSPHKVTAVLDGLTDALSGRRKALKPMGWDTAVAKFSLGATEDLLDRLRDLGALFGDQQALDALRTTASSPSIGIARRRKSLHQLIALRTEGVEELCEKLLEVEGMTVTAASGLALSDDRQVAERLLALWPKLQGAERSALLNILVSRPAWVEQVLHAVAEGKIERQEIGALQVSQIRAFNNAELTEQLDSLLGKGSSHGTGASPEVLAKWKERLTTEAIVQADPANGRRVFQTTCAVCHRLNGEGHHIGPDLTGTARDNLNYLLDNIVTPSASLANEYRQVRVVLADGRVLVGIAKPATSQTMKLQTTTELLTIALDEIEQQTVSPISMMPEGLLDLLDEQKVRDLFAYLMAKETPKPKTGP